MADAYMEVAARIALARERFLSAGETRDGEVRESILASWRRSRFWDVDVDRIEPPYRADLEPDNRLVRSAQPVLDRLEQELSDAPMSIILTDARGWVLQRRVGDRSLHRQLDEVSLTAGFSYAEEFIGTNGIGTALEEKRAAQVFGHEHFSERLQSLSCAGAVVRHPLTGRVEGLVDLTCWRVDASPLMRALAGEAARDVARRLVEADSERERALLREFMAACQRTRRPVLSLNDDLVITNARGAQLLQPQDHAALQEWAAGLLRSSRERSGELQLSRGEVVRVRGRLVSSRAGAAGALVEIESVEAPPRPRAGGRRRAGAEPRPLPLPGLAGRSPVWLEARQGAIAACQRRAPLLLQGEPGVGKLALARAVHQRFFPAERLRVLDAAGVREAGAAAWLDGVRRELGEPGGTVVLRHLDLLARTPTAEALAAELAAPRPRPSPWVVATLAAGAAATGSQALRPLLARFPAPVTVPPLRYRIDDLRDLVPLLLERWGAPGTAGCTAEALQTLLRCAWPRNVAQLEEALRRALERRGGGQIRLEDLPADCHAVTRRVLTRWEWIERDAIVGALVEAGGNRARAAAKLGISRATIYRKISAFGIGLP
jgi:sigma-54 dependent transcriptional regulator, acetoin dehydrogenase operon transcriptional activator AcoR